MRKRILWIAAALVLIAIPAVIGLVALRDDDDSSSSARRAAALLTPQDAQMQGATTVVMKGGKSSVLSGKEIEVESFSWGVANNGSVVMSGGAAGAGKSSFNDVSFTKRADEGSPSLMQACAAGEHFTEVTINVRKPAGTGKGTGGPYLTVVLTDVIISGYQQAGSASELPTESISLNFGEIKVTYDPKAAGAAGATGSPQTGGWNLKTSAKT